MRCPRCPGRVLQDQAGERSCLNCGWVRPDPERDPLAAPPPPPTPAERRRESNRRHVARLRSRAADA